MKKLAILLAFGALAALIVTLSSRDEGAGSASGDGDRSADRPTNVLLITVDTLRADRVGAYGRLGARTFAMDSLGEEGVRATRAITAAPITMPSHTTILSGLYPAAHGVRDNGNFQAPDELELISERLQGEGFETRAFVSAVVLDHRYNLDQGFEHYDDELWSEDEPPMFMIRERPADRTVDRVIEWLDERQGRDETRPFFTWMHLFDPHQPYTAPLQDRALAGSPYEGDIAFADRHIGRLFGSLRERGIYDDTLVILTSDHGESLGEHGEKTHAIFIYEATTRVPFFVRYPPMFPAGAVYEGPVRTVDIMPTILGALGLDVGSTQGRDLHRELGGHGEPPALPQYSESLLSQVGFGMAPLYGVRDGAHTYIRAPRSELYDRAADPRELSNLLEPEGGSPLAGDRERADALDAVLQSILDESAERGIRADGAEIDEETLRMLEALGYVGDVHVAEAVGGMDPKDGIRLHSLLEDGRHRCRDGDWEGALPLLDELLRQVPGHTSALNVRGMALLRLDRLEEAERAYLDSLAVQPSQPRALCSLARLRLRQDDPEGAIVRADEALRVAPDSVNAMVIKGLAQLGMGDVEAAEATYRRAVEMDSDFPRAHSYYGDLLFRRGEYRLALASYEQAIEVLPSFFRAINMAGVSAKRIGERERADAHFRRAAELREDAWRPVYNLACTASLAGEDDAAFEHLRVAVDRGFRQRRLLERDPDLEALRGDPRFASLLESVAVEQEPDAAER